MNATNRLQRAMVAIATMVCALGAASCGKEVLRKHKPHHDTSVGRDEGPTKQPLGYGGGPRTPTATSASAAPSLTPAPVAGDSTYFSGPAKTVPGKPTATERGPRH